MKPDKACPVVIREVASQISVLAFRHPLARCQLVKGSIGDETASEAAARELYEEAGIHAFAETELGVWDSNHEGHMWSFHLCKTATVLPEHWIHHCADDGGHDFEFFWHPLDEDPSSEWHPVHARALTHLKSVLTMRSSGRAKTHAA